MIKSKQYDKGFKTYFLISGLFTELQKAIYIKFRYLSFEAL